MKKLLLMIIATIMGLTMCACSTDSYVPNTSSYGNTTNETGSEDEVSIVKNGYLSDFSNEITIGNAMESFLLMPKWQFFETDKGERVVQCSGQCMAGGEMASVKVLFQLVEDNGIIFHSLIFNDVEENGYMASSFLDAAYNEAAAQ